jgi:MFS family permease
VEAKLRSHSDGCFAGADVIRSTLITLGVISLFAIPIASALPRSARAKRAAAISERRAPANVNRHDVLSATMGFVSDGLFPATIAVLLLESEGASTAAMAAGTILALKRAVVVVLGPISGRVADRFGALRTSIAGFVITAAGTILIAWGNVLAGAIVLVSGAAVSSTAIPLLANTDNESARLSSLARLGLARDVGAAAGPLIALPLFAAIGGAWLYGVATASLLAAAFIARPARSSRPTSSTSSLAWRPSSAPERRRSTP